ncbi:MAG: AAA family ATPase [Nitrospinota bacterium]|nr:AAA family ATPase [Nitrospinota bacterium]
MKKIVIFGNSGSGKSTLAKRLSERHKLRHLDLDILAWEKDRPMKRRSLKESSSEIETFMRSNHSWVIDGCYSSLLQIAMSECGEIIFLNPGEEVCLSNCNNRPWEPHKYASPEAQNDNLEMLLNWVRQYSKRTDEFSLESHQALFNGFIGKKIEYQSNQKG